MKVSVGGRFIEVISFSITKGIGRGYNVAYVSTLDEFCIVGDELEIIINGVGERFIISAISYGKNKNINITGKGLPFMLENAAYGHTSTLTYNNSDELINDSRGGISVVNYLQLIDF